MQIHGGKDNVIENNLFIECAAMISCSPWGEQRWRDFVGKALDSQEVDRAPVPGKRLLVPPEICERDPLVVQGLGVPSCDRKEAVETLKGSLNLAGEVIAVPEKEPGLGMGRDKGNGLVEGILGAGIVSPPVEGEAPEKPCIR